MICYLAFSKQCWVVPSAELAASSAASLMCSTAASKWQKVNVLPVLMQALSIKGKSAQTWKKLPVTELHSAGSSNERQSGARDG